VLAFLIAACRRDAALPMSGIGSQYSIEGRSLAFGRSWNGLNGIDRMSAPTACYLKPEQIASAT
jgi:hypothetical protein